VVCVVGDLSPLLRFAPADGHLLRTADLFGIPTPTRTIAAREAGTAGVCIVLRAKPRARQVRTKDLWLVKETHE